MELNMKTRSCLSAVILSAVIQADGFLCLTGPVAGGGGCSGNAAVSMSSQMSRSSSSPAARSSRRSAAAVAATTGSFSRCRRSGGDVDVFRLNLSPYEEYMATRGREAKGEAVEPEQHQKASLFERYMKSREKQATLSPAEKDKSLFEEYSQTRPTPAAAPVVQELSPYEEYMASRKKVEAAAAATTAEEKAKASLFSKYLAARGLTAEDEAKAPKEERAALFAKFVASRIKAKVTAGSGGVIGRLLGPLLKRLPGGKKRAEKQEQEEEDEAESEDPVSCEDPDSSSTPLNGAEIDVDGASRANWRVDVEYTEAEKISLFDAYIESREKVKAAMTSAQVTPEEVETVSAYDAYVASRAKKEAALTQMAPEEKTRSLFDDYMASRAPAATGTASSATLELKKSTFDSAVMDPTKHALVYFYAPWCVHCQNLDEDFQKLGKVFEKESRVVVAKVNAIDEKDLKQRFGVKKYPTLQYFYSGEVEVYTGARDLDSMVHFLDHMNQASAQQSPPPPPPPAQKRETKKQPGEKHIGTGGMADTRDPAPVNHADPRKSISAAPSFEEYLKSKRN